jgi:hypothetical protein
VHQLHCLPFPPACSWLGRRLGGLVLRGAANQTVPVATIPFSLAITHETALSHPQLGPHFAELAELGLVDERAAVVLLLMVEKMRGEGSTYAPWLQLLPERWVCFGGWVGGGGRVLLWWWGWWSHTCHIGSVYARWVQLLPEEWVFFLDGGAREDVGALRN